MKAIMMIAGKGTRLKPLTNYVPKCCLPIAGEPLLYIWLKKLKAFGIEQILLNPSHGKQYVQQAVLNAPVRFSQIILRPEVEPIGTAQTLLRNRDWIMDDDMLIIYADVLTNLCLDCMKGNDSKHKPLMTLAACPTDKPKEKGIINMGEGGWCEGFVEKPENPQGNLAWTGIAIARNSLLEQIPEDAVDLAGDVFTTDLITKMRVCYAQLAYFQDIGTPQGYLSAQMEWGKNNGF